MVVVVVGPVAGGAVVGVDPGVGMGGPPMVVLVVLEVVVVASPYAAPGAAQEAMTAATTATRAREIPNITFTVGMPSMDLQEWPEGGGQELPESGPIVNYEEPGSRVRMRRFTRYRAVAPIRIFAGGSHWVQRGATA